METKESPSGAGVLPRGKPGAKVRWAKLRQQYTLAATLAKTGSRHHMVIRPGSLPQPKPLGAHRVFARLREGQRDTLFDSSSSEEDDAEHVDGRPSADGGSPHAPAASSGSKTASGGERKASSGPVTVAGVMQRRASSLGDATAVADLESAPLNASKTAGEQQATQQPKVWTPSWGQVLTGRNLGRLTMAGAVALKIQQSMPVSKVAGALSAVQARLPSRPKRKEVPPPVEHCTC